MDIPTRIAEGLADAARAERKTKRAVKKSNRLANATAKARAKEAKHYERNASKLLQSKTRIGNLAGGARGAGLGGILGKLPK